jgi:hypothetical protein
MARTKTQIKSEITTPFMANENLANQYGYVVGASFDAEFSLVSLENILFEIVALAIFLHELMFGQHTKEVDEKLFTQRSGRKSWYKTLALNFQYGFDLVMDKDYFENGNATNEQIKASKIVKYAAVAESSDESRVIIKIAGETNGLLLPITPEQKEAFQAYIKDTKWAGVPTTVINYLPDRLYLNIQVLRDALVLDNNGMSILNANFPVNEAIQEFMKELPFDGDLRLSALVDKLQVVSGVLDATVVSAESAWINPDIGGYDIPQPIFISKIPVSGYYEVVTFDNINYVV